MRKLILGLMPAALAGAILLGGAGTVYAQRTGSTGGGGGLGGSTGGTGGGSLGGSSGGIGGGSLGGTTGGTGSATRTGGSTTGSANITYGTGAPQANYYGNPLSYGLNGNTEPTSSGVSSTNSNLGSSTIGSSGSGGGSSSSSSGFNNVQASPVAKFGQALYNVTPQSTFTQPTATGGTATTRPTTPSTQQPQTNARPTYTARIGFAPQAAPVSQVVADFQNAVTASTDLSKPSNRVQLVLDGNTVVLRGVVQDEHERTLAETLANMTPGVRGVRNELAVRSSSPEGVAAR